MPMVDQEHTRRKAHDELQEQWQQDGRMDVDLQEDGRTGGRTIWN